MAFGLRGIGVLSWDTMLQSLKAFMFAEDEMKISARNMLRGKVKKIEPGSVNTEVVIDLPGGQEIVSIITRRSAEDLGLKVGKEVMAVIKASSVMIAVD
jgi:molybdopterin-binding protein